MLTTIAVLALVGFAGGYAIAISELFADRREWWERRRDVNYGLLHDTLDELEYIRHGGILHYVLRNLAAAA